MMRRCLQTWTFSLTLCSGIQDTSVHFTSLSPLERTIDVISREWKVERPPEEREKWLDDILNPVWESIIQDDSIDTAQKTSDVQNRLEIERALGVTVSWFLPVYLYLVIGNLITDAPASIAR